MSFLRARSGLRGAAFGVSLALASACEDAPASAPAPLAPPSAAATKEPRAPVPTIVFLGDSLTAGFGLPEAEALPALIQQRVEAAGLPYRVINAGRSGDTTAGGLARLDWYFKGSLELRALVIGLGSNDAMRGLPLEAMEENLRKIVQRTRERAPDAKILLWELKTFPNLGPEYAGDYAAVFSRVAASEAVTLIPFPLEPVAARPELNQADGIHPNAEGTRLVAERVWQTLRTQL